MNAEQQDLVIRLREKIRMLISVYEKEKQERDIKEEELAELKKKLVVKQKEYELIEKKYNTLKLAKAIAGDNGENHEAKVKVNKIVREIDKCIALLNR